jgi:hypothetical protein
LEIHQRERRRRVVLDSAFDFDPRNLDVRDAKGCVDLDELRHLHRPALTDGTKFPPAIEH